MTSDLILKFADAEILLDDAAYRKLNDHNNSNELAESLINDLVNNGDSIFLLTEEMVDEFLEEKESSIEPIRQSKLLPQEFDFQIIRMPVRSPTLTGRLKTFHPTLRTAIINSGKCLPGNMSCKMSSPLKMPREVKMLWK